MRSEWRKSPRVAELEIIYEHNILKARKVLVKKRTHDCIREFGTLVIYNLK